MNCPVCNITLDMAVRSGIEIDYCPKCRGVWLDRGELDKLIERASGVEPWQASSAPPTASAPPPPAPPPYNRVRDRDHDDDDDDDDDYRRRRYKRKSFWSELFDFD